ncbi:hypothetical protein FE392_18420 [Xenorhabdus sp. 12]|uniref:Uncharacterized protein n=1 Tax=Xenorhabdus santafensis TaxID=2582833 RepID=A0ABU4SEN0_9GAMM|nr:hypothetical protein [Xenorhabdus sp. 12]MDX7989255.1 hypothetical protein [Xenorhabdus sp. 12]
MYKWFIALISIPMLIYGSFAAEFIPILKELIYYWENPISHKYLSKTLDGLLKSDGRPHLRAN